MGLSWQQGPLAPAAVGRFLTPTPLPERLLYAEPPARRMRVRFAGTWIADSEDVALLHEPGRYPVAYFPLGSIADGVLEDGQHVTADRDLGRRPGTPFASAGKARRGRPGTTPTCPNTRESCRGGLRSSGGRWTPSTKKTNGSSATPPIRTTGSTFARPAAICWSTTASGSSPTQRVRWRSTNRASRPAGTFRAPTWTSPLSLPSTRRHSARTRDRAVTTTSAATPGRLVLPGCVA